MEKEKIEKTDKKESFLDRFDKDKIIKVLYAIIAVLVLAIVIILIVKGINKGGQAKGVSKLLDMKYDSVACIDSDCNGFMAIEGDKLASYKVILFNVDGEKVASYSDKYDPNSKDYEFPFAVGKDFYLSSTTSLTSFENSNYFMKNKKGKVLYKTTDPMQVLNNNLVTVTSKKDSKITLLDKKGKVLYSNIKDLDSYINGKIIEMDIDGTYALLNENGEKFLNDYSIAKMVKDEDDKYLYAIVRNEKDKVYNYFDLLKATIVGDSFKYYTANDNVGEFTITKKENDKDVKYILTKDGKQTRLETEENSGNENLYKTFKEKIDTDEYVLYSRSLYAEDQENVLVDSKKEKAIGVLNIKSKEFTKIYSYKQDKTFFSSTVYTVGNNDDESKDKVLRITCSYYCDENNTVIYDIKNNKTLYTLTGENQVSDYVEYEDGYKVVTLYGYNDDKYTLYDKDNKSVYSSKNNILVIDKKIVVGKEPSYSIVLYSTKENKALNTSPVAVLDNKQRLYKYTDDDNTYVLNKEGKEIIKVGKKDYFKYIDNHYIYIKDNKLNIYNIEKDKTSSYSLKENEKMNDASGSMIAPYKNTIVINNSTDKYVKIINFKGKTIKKINKAEVSSVKVNDEAESAFIIVRQSKDNKDKYGLYVAR